MGKKIFYSLYILVVIVFAVLHFGIYNFSTNTVVSTTGIILFTFFLGKAYFYIKEKKKLENQNKEAS